MIFFHIVKKEVKDLFFSPLIYILSGLFCLLMGWLFFNYLVVSKEITNKTLESIILAPIFGNMNFVFLFLCPIMTMNTFAGEKSKNTIDLLLRSNLSNWQLVLGKMAAQCLSVIFMISLTFLFPFILSFSGLEHWGVIFSSYIGLFFAVVAYLSVGVFTSTLCENPLISALFSFCILLSFVFIVMSASASTNYLIGQMLSYLSPAIHYQKMVGGLIRSTDLIYFFSFTGLFLYLAKSSLDSRRW